jgi:uncharacterized protein YndB with AHSA1/START domain
MNPNRTTMDRTSEKEIVIKRTLRAPPRIVFDAWTRPELVRRWWAPATRGVTMIECSADLRPGGTYRYVIGRSESEQFAFSGTYIEITSPSRLVYTQRFEAVPGEAVVTVSFEERDGSTLLVAHELYPSKEALDGAIASGMEEGMRETMEQLDELVFSLRT